MFFFTFKIKSPFTLQVSASIMDFKIISRLSIDIGGSRLWLHFHFWMIFSFNYCNMVFLGRTMR